MSNQRIVGIDLGTTNSLVAFMQGDVPVVIPGDDGLNLVPSVVALNENDQIIVGNAARKYLIETPERAVYSIKRLMGRGIEDIREELKLFPFRLAEDLQPGEVLRIKLGDKTFTPPEISAFILRQLKRNAERFFGAPVPQAVLASLKSTPAKMVVYSAYLDPRPSEWLSQNAGIAAVKLPFTVGGTEGAKDLFGLFDDTLARMLAALGTNR